jgi:hypothetical protein
MTTSNSKRADALAALLATVVCQRDRLLQAANRLTEAIDSQRKESPRTRVSKVALKKICRAIESGEDFR